jgi:hypothetical protein
VKPLSVFVLDTSPTTTRALEIHWHANLNANGVDCFQYLWVLRESHGDKQNLRFLLWINGHGLLLLMMMIWSYDFSVNFEAKNKFLNKNKYGKN